MRNLFCRAVAVVLRQVVDRHIHILFTGFGVFGNLDLHLHDLAVSAERHSAGLRFCVYRARACVRTARAAPAADTAGRRLLKIKFSAVFNNFLNHLTRRYLKNFYVACIVFKCHVETVCFIVALDNDFRFDFLTGTARYFSEKNTYACVGVFPFDSFCNNKVNCMSCPQLIYPKFIGISCDKRKVIAFTTNISA